MNNDIVTWLRTSARRKGWPLKNGMLAAADEIDRLRIELDIYQRLYAEELVRKALENNGL